MNGYDLSKNWFDFCFENPEKINTNHSALYFFILSHSNRLGWKPKFGLPTTMTMEAIGIKSYNTYIKSFNDLNSFGFIEVLEKSKNQYSSNIIALSKFDKATNKALDKATIKHTTKQHQKQGESTQQSNDSIDIPIYNDTNSPINEFNNNILFEEEKEKDLPPKGESFNFSNLLKKYNEIFERKCTVISLKTEKQLKTTLKRFSQEQIIDAMNNVKSDSWHNEQNYTHATLEFFSRADKVEKWAFVTKNSNNGTQQSIPSATSTPRKLTIDERLMEGHRKFSEYLDEQVNSDQT